MRFKEIKYAKFLARGHRGVIYTGIYRGKKVALKAKKPGSQAVGRIANEALWLKVINRHGIGPKLIFSKKSYFVYQFAEGEFIPKYLEKASKREIKKVIADVFRQCHQLDLLGIDKEEMHRPFKHVVVDKGRSVLIDFERVHESEKPKNTTQFCQYIMSRGIAGILRKKGFSIQRRRIIAAARRYKREQTKANLKKILDAVFIK